MGSVSQFESSRAVQVACGAGVIWDGSPFDTPVMERRVRRVRELVEQYGVYE
jgi:hypothetical protein